MNKKCLLKFLGLFLCYALGYFTNLILENIAPSSANHVAVSVGMSENEVVSVLGAPIQIEQVFGIKAPEEWPDSAKNYLIRNEPVKIMVYKNVEVYISETKNVCRVRFIGFSSSGHDDP